MGKKIAINPKTPSMSRNADVHLLYAYNIKEMMRRKYLRFHKGDVYDGEL